MAERAVAVRPGSLAGGGRWSRWLRGLALALAVACFSWVLWPVIRHGRELAATLHGAALLREVAVGAGVYAAASTLLAAAWWWLAGIYGGRVRPRLGYAIWARSQWAKYLPGNTFQFVSRQLLGHRAGLSHAALVASGVLETASLLAAAVLVGSGLAAWGAAGRGASLPAAWVFAAALAGLLAWPALDLLLRRWPRTAGWMVALPALTGRRLLALLAPALALHALFFVATGWLLRALAAAGWEGAVVPVAGAIRIYAFAWVAGTLSFGAPAGAGVREAILTLQLAPVAGPAGAAALALALRLVTTGGDLVTAGIGWLLPRQPGEPPAGTAR